MKYLKEYKEFEWDIQEEDEDDYIPNDFIGYEKFYDFLVENDALDKWIKNLKGREIKEFLDNNIQYESQFINRSFTWANTPEGYHYWEELSNKWANL